MAAVAAPLVAAVVPGAHLASRSRRRRVVVSRRQAAVAARGARPYCGEDAVDSPTAPVARAVVAASEAVVAMAATAGAPPTTQMPTRSQRATSLRSSLSLRPCCLRGRLEAALGLGAARPRAPEEGAKEERGQLDSAEGADSSGAPSHGGVAIPTVEGGERRARHHEGGAAVRNDAPRVDAVRRQLPYDQSRQWTHRRSQRDCERGGGGAPPSATADPVIDARPLPIVRHHILRASVARPPSRFSFRLRGRGQGQLRARTRTVIPIRIRKRRRRTVIPIRIRKRRRWRRRTSRGC